MEDLNNEKSLLTQHKVANYIWTRSLKSNIVGAKCVALSESMDQLCINLTSWLQKYYDPNFKDIYLIERNSSSDCVQVDDFICELLVTDLNMLSEVILAAKKVSLLALFMF